MDEAAVRKLLDRLTAGEVDADEAVRQLRALPYTDLGYATVDAHRELRQGVPESVYGPGKSASQCVGIIRELLSSSGGPVVLSRASEEQRSAVTAELPGARVRGATVVWRPAPMRDMEPVGVITAGTADLPVAEECQATLDAFGIPSRALTDVGVAGIHRLLDRTPEIQRAPANVVVAGMEGALASVVGGLTSAPVVAVPTSTGYGASLQGVTALLAMLSSCASGLVVVGIDNGFGAAFAIHRLLH
ncbi:MAG TPA: nickel pincer cofactor biosynthesis protein LarB [Acidimicrobiales bacterium]|nr:nickel pincer cofactor biosynthesis protein LarB [Acidimicrobiales bacterium]